MFLQFLETIKLQNAKQSSTETKDLCNGKKCPASAAIDGDVDTVSVTKYIGK